VFARDAPPIVILLTILVKIVIQLVIIAKEIYSITAFNVKIDI
jgi:hypothetical protein